MQEELAALDAIGLRNGTDKASHHHDFLRLYESRLRHRRSDPLLMIEIGVQKGGSLRTWGEYFSQGTIVGIDIDPTCVTHQGENRYVRIGDQSDPSLLFDVVAEFGRPDIILDDGSHRWDHQIQTLQTLYPLLKAGGVYIVEDIDTSFDAYLEEFPFQGFSQISAFDYLVQLARKSTGGPALQKEAAFDLFVEQSFNSVESIEFLRKTALICKKL